MACVGAVDRPGARASCHATTSGGQEHSQVNFWARCPRPEAFLTGVPSNRFPGRATALSNRRFDQSSID